MITRGDFGARLVGIGIAAQSVATMPIAKEQQPRTNSLMHVGGDYHSIVGGDITSKQNLEYNVRHGVKHLTAEISKNPQGIRESDDLKRMKDNCDRYGVVLEAIRMNSRYINLMRKGPERDREIEIIVGNIRKAARIGLRSLPITVR
jgi:hypothetical protein